LVVASTKTTNPFKVSLLIYHLCGMRKYSADYIFSPSGKLVANHTLITDDQGKIIDLVQGVESDAKFFNGILSPGFINAHCHLELSHLKNKITPGNGLDGFIKDIVKIRANNNTDIETAITQTDKLMWEKGIQAVGDICNTDHTFEVKKSSHIRYHSFIELFNFKPEEANSTLVAGQLLYHKAKLSHQNASIIPHAPYSVPPELFHLIQNLPESQNANWCIHNQESVSENEMFISGMGSLMNFFTSAGIDMRWFIPTGKNSLPSISNYFPKNSHLLFVHNTFTSKSDITFMKSDSNFDRSWFCMCPKANLYIEKQLPDISMLDSESCKLIIGTDSLASNNELSILDELRVIQQQTESISTEKLLTWATINGASYFGWSDLGTFTKNANPGVIQITKADVNRIHPDSEVLRIH